MSRPDFSLMPIPEAAKLLVPWITPHIPPKRHQPLEKASDAWLVALAILHYIRKVPYFSSWYTLLTVDLGLTLPSLPQYHIRLKRLVAVVEKLACEIEELNFVLIDSEPIPVCRNKRAHSCKFPGATFGYATQGKFFGYKFHAWSAMNGKIVYYTITPANEHDFTAGLALNDRWAAFGGPRIIGDKAYYGGGYVVPPKSNTKSPDKRWKNEFKSARQLIECAFSSIAGRGLRWGQVKTLSSLRLKVACIVAAYNLRFRSFAVLDDKIKP